MDSKEPPLGGSRGTDPMDVVVWFGGNPAHGWPQRILTLNGVQHRGGEDPHSKNSAAAHALVNRYYQLGHDTKQEQQQQGTTVGLHQRPSSAVSFRRVPTNSNQHWLPMPKVRSKLCNALRGARRQPLTLEEGATEVGTTLENGACIDQENVQRSDALNTSTRRAISPLSMSGGGDSFNGGGGSFSWGHHPIGVHDSLTLNLYRQAEEQLHETVDTVGTGATTTASKRKDRRRTLTSAGSGRPRRPTSAASTAASEASSAASAKRSLADSRRGGGLGSAPKSVDDFPTAAKCRDLDATIALTRAAAVIDCIDRAAAREAKARRGEDPDQTQPEEGEEKQPLTEANALPTTTTIMTLKKTLGSSIMHTIHKTNALHAQMLDAKGLEEGAGAAAGGSDHQLGSNATHVPHILRAAAERKMYQHIPRDEADRLKLRRLLENMQTEFAKREIEADMDAFKLRTVQTKRRGGSSSATRPMGGGGSGAAPSAVGGQNANTTLTPAALHRLLQVQAENKRKGSASVGKQRTASQPSVLPDYGSHIYQTGLGAAGAFGGGIQIPVQSKISIGGHTFVYSELFRPVEDS